MSDLQAIRTIIARLNSGKNANEDSWMTYVSLIRCMALTLSIFLFFSFRMWNGTNWGDLLQPAPLALALLGTIMTVASSLDDFRLCFYDSHVYVNQSY
jgi:hypothetical protein